jgi:hypothetical protein
MAETVNQSNEGVVARVSVLEEKVTALTILMTDKFNSFDVAMVLATSTVEKTLSAALVSQDKLTTAAFQAAKEALKEAQGQLAEYKSSSNEWRATLTDLISKGMLRPEIESLMRAANDKEGLLEKRVNSLEITRGEATGKAAAYASIAGFIGVVAAIIGHFWH